MRPLRACSSLLLVFALMSTAATAPFGQERSSGVTASVDSLLTPEILPDGPGAAVAITRHGQVIYKRCFGLASLEHKVPIAPETAFNLASVTKQFTALAVLLLEQDEMLSLDDDIHKYFPELPAYGATVTLRHLLHHTSGLWEYSTMLRYYGGRHAVDYTSLDDVLALLKGQEQLLFTPGSQFSYCNTNYALLAEVVARVTNESFASWTQHSIFEPLGMKNTLFREDCFQVIPHAADCYYESDGAYYKDPRNSNVIGESYLYSTIDDMTQWLDNFRLHRVGGDALIERMFQKSALNDGSPNSYSYGLGVEERNGQRIISHSGQTGSFLSMVIYAPDDEVGIVILSNSQQIRAEPLGHRILDIFFPAAAEDTEAIPASAPQPFISVDSARMEGLGGGYVIDGSGGKLMISRLEDGFYGIMDGFASAVFHPVSDSQLTNDRRNAFITIHDEDGHRAGRIMLDLREAEMTLWATRIDLPAKTPNELAADYAGTYYSAALGTAYDVDVEDGALVVRHRRYGARPLQPTDKDEFVGSIGIVRFSRDTLGHVTRLLITDEDTHFKPLTFMRL